MKFILFLFFSLIATGALYAQKMPELSYNVRISEADKTIRAEINPVHDNSRAKPGLYYYWYGSNSIHSTQGGYAGNLLNGQYSEYYLNKSLKAQGSFKKGLKNGAWKTWNEDGTLAGTVNWSNGVIAPGNPRHFWQKINIFRKKDGHSSADSSAHH